MKKTIALILILLIALCCITGCGETGDNPIPSADPTTEVVSGSLQWPKFGVCQLLPVPPASNGYINDDSSDEADIDVYEISQDQYNQYVAACQEKGFVIDYDYDDTDYEAWNEDGYYLWIDYDQDTQIMNVWIYYDEDFGEDESEDLDGETTEAETAAPTEAPTEAPSTEAPTEAQKETGLRSDFKEAMDSYEAFMDEYVAFMKKYKANPSDLSLLMEYATFMEEYAEFVEDFEKWDSEDLNDAELAYYLEVNARVTKKLAEII